MNNIEELPVRFAYIEGLVAALDAVSYAQGKDRLTELIYSELNELKDDLFAIWRNKMREEDPND